STQSTVDTSVSIYSFYSKIGTLYRETMANYTSSSLESSCLSAIPPVTSCSTDVPCIQTFDRVDGRFNHLTPGITYVEPETIPEFLAISVGYNTDYVSDFSSIFSSSAWKTVSTDGTTLPYLTLIPIPLGLSYRSSLSSTSSSYELKATSVSHSFSNDTDTFLFMGSSSTILSNNSVVMSVSVTATDPDRSSSTITKIYNPSNEILAIAVFSSDLSTVFSYAVIDCSLDPIVSVVSHISSAEYSLSVAGMAKPFSVSIESPVQASIDVCSLVMISDLYFSGSIVWTDLTLTEIASTWASDESFLPQDDTYFADYLSLPFGITIDDSIPLGCNIVGLDADGNDEDISSGEIHAAWTHLTCVDYDSDPSAVADTDDVILEIRLESDPATENDTDPEITLTITVEAKWKDPSSTTCANSLAPIWKLKPDGIIYHGICELFVDDPIAETINGIHGPGLIFGYSTLGDLSISFSLGNLPDIPPIKYLETYDTSSFFSSPLKSVQRVSISQSNVDQDIIWDGDGNGYSSGAWDFRSTYIYDSTGNVDECKLNRSQILHSIDVINYKPNMNPLAWFTSVPSYILSHTSFARPVHTSALVNGCATGTMLQDCVYISPSIPSYSLLSTGEIAQIYMRRYSDSDGMVGIEMVCGEVYYDYLGIPRWAEKDIIRLSAEFTNGSLAIPTQYSYKLHRNPRTNDFMFFFLFMTSSTSNPGIVFKISSNGTISVICSRDTENGGFAIKPSSDVHVTVINDDVVRGHLSSSYDISIFDNVPIRASSKFELSRVVMNFNGCLTAASQENGCDNGVCATATAAGTCSCSDGFSFNSSGVCSSKSGVSTDLMFPSNSISASSSSSSSVKYELYEQNRDTISLQYPLPDDTEIIILNKNSQLDVYDLHPISRQTPLIVSSNERSRIRIPLSSSHPQYSSLPSSSFLFLSEAYLDRDPLFKFDLLFIPPIVSYTEWDMMIVAAGDTGISAKMPDDGTSSVSSTHSAHVIVPSLEFSALSDELILLIDPPIVLEGGSATKIQEIRSFSTLESYYSSVIGIQLMDDTESVLQTLSFSALLNPDVYNSLDQFVVFYGQPPSSLISACGDADDTPGIDIEGYWFGLRSELSNSSSSSDEETLYGFQILFFVSLSGAQCSLISLNNSAEDIPSIAVSALGQPSLNGVTLTTENCGFSSPSMSHLVAAVRYPDPSSITEDTQSEISELDMTAVSTTGCVHGVVNDSLTCDCDPAYDSDERCEIEVCVTNSAAQLYLRRPSIIPISCVSIYNASIMTNLSNQYVDVISSSTVYDVDTSMSTAIVGEDKRLTVFGGQVDGLSIYASEGARIILVGSSFSSQDNSDHGPGSLIQSYRPVEPLNFDEYLTISHYIFTAAQSYSVSESLLDLADIPTLETYVMDDPTDKIMLIAPISVGGMFAKELIVTPRGDLCVSSAYEIRESQLSTANCAIGIIGLINDQTTASLNNPFMDPASGELGVTKVAIGVETSGNGSYDYFHIRIYAQKGSSLDTDIMIDVSISTGGMYSIVIAESSLSYTTTLTLRDAVSSPSSDIFCEHTLSHDLGTQVILSATPISYSLELVTLTCSHGSAVSNDGDVYCQCDDRWRGEYCDTCSLAYWGDELNGCLQPNCRGRCDDSRCVAVSDNTAYCDCEDASLVYSLNSGSQRSLFSKTVALLDADADADSAYLDLIDTYGTDTDVCNIHLNPRSELTLNNIGVNGSIIAGSSSTISVTGNVFMLGGHTRIFSQEPIHNDTAKSEITNPQSSDLYWQTTNEDAGLISNHSACLIGEVSSYDAYICSAVEASLDSSTCTSSNWLSFSCEDGFSSRIIDTSTRKRGEDVSDAVGLMYSFSASECSQLTDSCIIPLELWPIPLYSNSIHYLQFYAGQILLLDEDQDEIGIFTPVNEEVSAPVDVYFDDLDGDSGCFCCNHRILLISTVETLSFTSEVQISLYRDGRITIDYALEEAVDVASKVRPSLEVSGRESPDLSIPGSSLMFGYSSREGCESSSSPAVEFSISYLPTQSFSLNIAADECENICLFGVCAENFNGVNECSCGVRFIGDYCDFCAGGWESPSDTDLMGEHCTSASCSYYSGCNDNGTCSGNEMNGVQQCVCDAGYVGVDCATATPEVECESTCENGGICFLGECHCVDGYNGEDCSEIECSDGCSEDIGGGECDTSSGECVCYSNWSGDDCSVYSSDGSCQYGVDNGSGCTCQLNYSGDYCQCKNNCSLHGLCNEWGCECEAGFSGSDCSIARVPVIDTDSIYIDYDEAVIGFSFENMVTISGVDAEDITFDCSILINEFGDSELLDSVGMFDSSTICKRSGDFMSFLIYPGHRSWVTSEMTFTLVSSNIIDKVTRQSSKSTIEIYLDPSFFPSTEEIPLPDSLVPQTLFLCQSGSTWTSHGLSLDVSSLQHTGWGRIYYVWSIVLADGQTNSTLDLLNSWLLSLSSIPPSSSSVTQLASFSPVVTIPSSIITLLAQDNTLEYMTLHLEATNLFHSVWSEKEYEIEFVRNSSSISFSVPSFPHELHIDKELVITPQVTCSECNTDGVAYIDTYCEVSQVVWSWKCLNASKKDSILFSTPVAIFPENSLQIGTYLCSVQVEYDGVSKKRNIEFTMIEAEIAITIEDVGSEMTSNPFYEAKEFISSNSLSASSKFGVKSDIVESSKYARSIHRTARPGDSIRLQSFGTVSSVSSHWTVTRDEQIVMTTSGSELSFFIPAYVSADTLYCCTAYMWSDSNGTLLKTSDVYVHVLAGDRRSDMDWTDDLMLGLSIQGITSLEEGKTMRLRAIPHGYSSLSNLSFSWNLDVASIPDRLVELAESRLKDDPFEDFTVDDSHLLSILVIEGQNFISLCNTIGYDKPCFNVQVCDSLTEQCVSLSVCVELERLFGVVYPIMMTNIEGTDDLICSKQHCLGYTETSQVTSDDIYIEVESDTLSSVDGDLLSQELQCEEFSRISTTIPKTVSHDPVSLLISIGDFIVISNFSSSSTPISLPCSYLSEEWMNYLDTDTHGVLPSFSVSESNISAYSYVRSSASVKVDVESLSGTDITVMGKSLLRVKNTGDSSSTAVDILDYNTSVSHLIRFPFSSYSHKLDYCESVGDVSCIVHACSSMLAIANDIIEILQVEIESKGSNLEVPDKMRNMAFRFMISSHLYVASLKIIEIIEDTNVEIYTRMHAFNLFLNFMYFYIENRMETVPYMYSNINEEIVIAEQQYSVLLNEGIFPIVDGISKSVTYHLRIEGDLSGASFIDLLPNAPIAPNDYLRQRIARLEQYVSNIFFDISAFSSRSSLYLDVIVAFAGSLPKYLESGEISSKSEIVTFSRFGGVDMLNYSAYNQYCDMTITYNSLFDDETLILFNEYDSLIGCPLELIQSTLITDKMNGATGTETDEELDTLKSDVLEQARSVPALFAFNRQAGNSLTRLSDESETDGSVEIFCDGCFAIKVPKTSYISSVSSSNAAISGAIKTHTDTELYVRVYRPIADEYEEIDGIVEELNETDEEGNITQYYIVNVSNIGIYLVCEREIEVEDIWVKWVILIVCILMGIGIITGIALCFVKSRKRNAKKKRRQSTYSYPLDLNAEAHYSSEQPIEKLDISASRIMKSDYVQSPLTLHTL
ncbi:hypothetical protein ADUPG1_007794, partial [Aduncisulcus paluster]